MDAKGIKSTRTSTAPPQNAGAYQLEGENLIKFRACAQRLAQITAKMKARVDAKGGSLSSLDPADLTDSDANFVQVEVCAQVTNVLNAVINDLTYVPDVAKFLLDYLRLVVDLLRVSRSLRSILLETLMRLLNCDPTQPSDKRFYTKYGVSGNENWENGTKGKFAIRPKATGSGDSLKVTSAYLIQFINCFGDWSGFDQIARRIHEPPNDPPPSFMHYAYFASILGGLEPYFDPRMTKKFIPSLRWDVPLLLRRIAELTDEELKAVSRDMLRQLTNRLIDVVASSKELKVRSADAAEKIQLCMIDRLLRSDILEKRINGILDLADVVRVLKLTSTAKNGFGLSSKAQAECDALPACHAQPKSFLEWVDKSGLVARILALDSHVEILKRSPIILKYLASQSALSVDPIFHLLDSVLWSGTAHEGLVRIIYDLVADVSPELNDDTLDQLIGRLKQIPHTKYTDVYMRFLCKLAQLCSRSQPTRALPLLNIFWGLVVSPDNSGVSMDCAQSSIHILADLFALPQFDHQRIPHIERAMKALQVPHAPVLNLLRFLTNTLNTFPPQSDPAQWSQATLIAALDGKLGLTKIYFDEIARYHNEAKRVFETIQIETDEARDNANPIVSGSRSHTDNLQSRLDFLHFCLDRCKQFPLSPAHIDVLWRVFVSSALTSNDSTQFFRWLQLLIDDAAASAGESTIVGTTTTSSSSGSISAPRRRPFTPLSEEVVKHITRLMMENIPFAHITIDAYRCIELYFCYVNYLDSHLAYASKRHMSVVSPRDLLYLDRLWLLASTATDKRIGATSRVLLVSLYTKLDPRISKRRNEAYALFIDRCVNDLNTFRQRIQQEDQTQMYTKMVIQYLLILDIFLHACDKIAAPTAESGSPTPTAAAQRTPTGDSESGSDPKSTRGVDNFHRFTLSNTDAYFNVLFDLLSLGGEIGSRVWHLLTKLPTNRQLEANIIGIAEAQQKGEIKRIEWETLLAANSTIKMFYILQIIHAYLRRSTDHANARSVQAWSQVFLLHGGFEFVYNFVSSLSLDSVFIDSPLSLQCLASLIKLIGTFMAFAPGSTPAKIADDIIQYQQFIPILIQIIEKATHIRPNEHATRHSSGSASASASASASVDTDSHVRVGGLVLNTFQLLSHCLTRVPNPSPHLSLVTHHTGWDSILHSGLNHSLVQIRDQTAAGVELLCTDNNSANSQTPVDSTPAGSLLPSSAALASDLLRVFLPKLLHLLPDIDTRSVRCLAYFSLTRKLLSRACRVTPPIDLNAAQLVSDLTRRIESHPIIEVRATDEDFVIAGLFHIMQEIISQQPQLKARCKSLVKNIFDSLFTLPVTRQWSDDESNSELIDSPPPPKCKSAYTRRSAFCLLDELVFESLENCQYLVDLLLPLHAVSHSGGSRSDEWEFDSGLNEKADCGYVGLKNHAATCYLNSTLQQFFMIPDFRRHLLAATPAKEEPIQQSVLYQLQYIMAFLQESEKQAFDPIGLCRSFVDFDGNPINVSVQEDAAGFMTRLIDKLMDQLRGTPMESQVKSTIYGRTLDQFIGHPPRCTHYKERSEEFPMISLTVRNMKTIQDSLKSFVQGEDMTGSNAYKCALCDAKVDTTKRTVFNQLPPTIIFNLKRFELNYETMRTFKINDRMEFTNRLNMRPYTKVGIQEMERDAARRTATQAAPRSGSADTPSNESSLDSTMSVSAAAAAASPMVGPSVDSDPHPAWYYEYELSGVTVHTGSMDRGHYYSFINTQPTSRYQNHTNRNEQTSTEQQTKLSSGSESDTPQRWIEFNDTLVRPFDVRSLADECFGGVERIHQFNAAGRSVETIVEKQRNAYLLFYTRVRPPKQNESHTPTPTPTVDTNQPDDTQQPKETTHGHDTDETTNTIEPNQHQQTHQHDQTNSNPTSPTATVVTGTPTSTAGVPARVCPIGRAPIPNSIFTIVRDHNLTYWRDRFVFDPMYFDFLFAIVTRAMQHWLVESKAQITQPKDTQHTTPTRTLHDAEYTIGQLHRLQSDLTQLSTRFVFDTLCRSRHKSQLPNWLSLLSHAYRVTPPVTGQWLLSTMAQPDNSWNKEILLAAPSVQVRQAMATIINQVMQQENQNHTDNGSDPSARTTRSGVSIDSSSSSGRVVLLSYIDSLVGLLRIVPDWWRRFNQFFHVLDSFSRLTLDHTEYLLVKHDCLARVLDLYLGDSSPLPHTRFCIPVDSSNRRVAIGDPLVRPDMTNFLALIARLVQVSETIKESDKANSQPTGTDNTDPHDTRTEVGSKTPIPLSDASRTLLQSNSFLTRIVSDCTSRRRGEYVSAILGHHARDNVDFSRSLIVALVTGIQNDQVDTMRPYFRIIDNGIFRWNDSLTASRHSMLLSALLRVMEAQSAYWKPTEFCIEHLIRVASRHPAAAAWLRSHPTESLDWMIRWLSGHPNPPRPGESTLMHKPARIDPATQLQGFHPLDAAAFAPRSWPNIHMTTQHKLSWLERMRASDAHMPAQVHLTDPLACVSGVAPLCSDSDEDLSDRTFSVGDCCDALDSVNEWVSARVVDRSADGRTVKLHFDGWTERYDMTLPADSIRITKSGRFANRNRTNGRRHDNNK